MPSTLSDPPVSAPPATASSKPKTFGDALRNVDFTDAVVKDAEAALDTAKAAHAESFAIVADGLKKHTVVMLSDGKAVVADPASSTGYKMVDPANEDTLLD